MTQRAQRPADTGTSRTAQRFTPPKLHRIHPERHDHQVTDHALVRYFERVLGLDVEAIRSGILTPEQATKAAALQTVDFALGPGVRAIVRGGRVVTIK